MSLLLGPNFLTCLAHFPTFTLLHQWSPKTQTHNIQNLTFSAVELLNGHSWSLPLGTNSEGESWAATERWRLVLSRLSKSPSSHPEML